MSVFHALCWPWSLLFFYTAVESERQRPRRSFLAGTLAIGDPSSAPNIPTPIIQLCEAMQHLVVASVLKPYDLVAHAGFWRVLTCRYSARTDSRQRK